MPQRTAQSFVLPPRPELTWPSERIAEFCRRWKIVELSVFGSVLREDFGPDSDVDLLARFAPDGDWSLFDHARMERELVEILGREVDLVNRSALEHSSNWIRRREILETARTIYDG